MANCLTLKKSNCKSCFRCVRKCPVKAIRFSGNQAHIIGNECILCGNCVVQCPQNAKEIADGIKLVNEANPSDAAIKLKSLETMEKVADGNATKLIIPSELQGLAGMCAAAKEVIKDK